MIGGLVLTATMARNASILSAKQDFPESRSGHSPSHAVLAATPNWQASEHRFSLRETLQAARYDTMHPVPPTPHTSNTLTRLTTLAALILLTGCQRDSTILRIQDAPPVAAKPSVPGTAPADLAPPTLPANIRP